MVLNDEGEKPQMFICSFIRGFFPMSWEQLEALHVPRHLISVNAPDNPRMGDFFSFTAESRIGGHPPDMRPSQRQNWCLQFLPDFISREAGGGPCSSCLSLET